MADDEQVMAKARDVYAALTANGASFTEFLDADFSSWRVFFRAVKDFAADESTALAALTHGFLTRHEICVSHWGKSVKERSALFKDEFERFIALPEVRDALARDLGVVPPQGAPRSPLASLRPGNAATNDVHGQTPSTKGAEGASSGASAFARGATESPAAPRAADENREPTADEPSSAEPGDHASRPPRGTSAAGGTVQVELDVSQTHVSVRYHRERVLAYLGGFKALLLDVQEKIDEIATSAVTRVGGAVDRANDRVEQALARLEGMVREESGERAPGEEGVSAEESEDGEGEGE